jgi:hypothetical protein
MRIDFGQEATAAALVRHAYMSKAASSELLGEIETGGMRVEF